MPSTRRDELGASDATFCAQAGMNGQGNSFYSTNDSSRYIRRYNDLVHIAGNGGSNAFDATAAWSDDVSSVVATPWTP